MGKSGEETSKGPNAVELAESDGTAVGARRSPLRNLAMD
jgi:hypothetical protein